jgi:hypothetical protein
MFKRSAVIGLIAMSMVVSGSARAEEDERAPAFGPGEQCTYTVKYLGMSAGTAQVTVGSETVQWGQPVWPIVTVARTDLVFFPVKDRFVTYWDRAAQRSLGSDLFADEGRKRRRQKMRLDHAAGTVTVTKQKEGEAENESVMEIEPGSGDIAAAMFALRNKPLAEGSEFEMPVTTGTRNFRLKAKIEKRQTLATSLGEREVFKVRVQTGFAGKFQSKRDLWAYITTDDSHLPVRIEAEFVLGSLIADLTHYQPGTSLAVR